MIKISFKCRSYIIRIDLLLLSNKTFNFQNNMYGKDKIELITSWFHVTLHQFMVSCESLKRLWLFFMYCRIFIILHDCILPGIPKVPLKPGRRRLDIMFLTLHLMEKLASHTQYQYLITFYLNLLEFQQTWNILDEHCVILLPCASQGYSMKELFLGMCLQKFSGPMYLNLWWLHACVVF